MGVSAAQVMQIAKGLRQHAAQLRYAPPVHCGVGPIDRSVAGLLRLALVLSAVYRLICGLHRALQVFM